MKKEQRERMNATLQQIILNYSKYLTDDCFDDDSKRFFVEQIEACTAKLFDMNRVIG